MTHLVHLALATSLACSSRLIHTGIATTRPTCGTAATLLAALLLPLSLKERKKERFCTGLSASAMGPRAVAGGVCAVWKHLLESQAQQWYMHYMTSPTEQAPNVPRHRHGGTIAHTKGTATYQQPAGGSGTQHRCAHSTRAQQQRHPWPAYTDGHAHTPPPGLAQAQRATQAQHQAHGLPPQPPAPPMPPPRGSAHTSQQHPRPSPNRSHRAGSGDIVPGAHQTGAGRTHQR